MDPSPPPPPWGAVPPPPGEPPPSEPPAHPPGQQPTGYGIRPYPQPEYPPPPPYGYAPVDPRPGPSAALVYAGFWIRFGAWFIDAVILTAVLFILGHFASIGYHIDSTVRTIDGVNQNTTGVTVDGPWPFLITGVYYVLLWWTYGGTVGQLLLRLRVVRVVDGNRPTIGRLVLRYIGFIIASLPFGLGLAWAAWDPRKQGWHDKIADTLVVAPR
jgi:uncharacterized RDD family membrane protein YckC